MRYHSYIYNDTFEILGLYGNKENDFIQLFKNEMSRMQIKPFDFKKFGNI